MDAFCMVLFRKPEDHLHCLHHSTPHRTTHHTTLHNFSYIEASFNLRYFFPLQVFHHSTRGKVEIGHLFFIYEA